MLNQEKKGSGWMNTVLTWVDQAMSNPDAPLDLVRTYEDACLSVHDGVFANDRAATAIAMASFMDVSDRMLRQPGAVQDELRTFIEERGFVPPHIEEMTCDMAAAVRTVPEIAISQGLRARGGAGRPEQVARIECALEFVSLAAARTFSTRSGESIEERARRAA